MKKILFFLLISIKAFSQGSVKISDMPAATSLTGTEIVPIVQGGINKKATVSLWPNNTIVVSSNTTAVNDAVYTVVASATFTDPTPVEGKGFTVFIRNGTGTVGGTGYSVAGTQIRRIFHSGSWANYIGGGFEVPSLAEAQAGTDNTKGMTPLRVASVTEKVYNVKAYGAKGDTRSVTAFISSGSTTLTSYTSIFTAGDIGKTISIPTGAASNDELVTTITGYTSPTQVTINTATSSALATNAVFGVNNDQVKGRIVSGSLDTFTALSSAFVVGDVGKSITIQYVGNASGTASLTTTIATYVSPTVVTLTTPATIPTSVIIFFGTDDTAAIQSTINAAFNAGGGNVYFPNGNYCIAGNLVNSDINGLDPNSQLYIPASATTSISVTPRQIKFIGESYSHVIFDKDGINNLGVKLVALKSKGTGTLPSVIGGIGTDANNPIAYWNATTTYWEHMSIVMSCNNGFGSNMVGLNGLNLTNINATNFHVVSTFFLYSLHYANPLGTGFTGVILTGKDNNIANVWNNCMVGGGMEYGYVLGEHLYLNSLFSSTCYYGFTFSDINFLISGNLNGAFNRHDAYFPEVSTPFQVNPGTSFVDLTLENETSGISGAPVWIYTAGNGIIKDVSNFGRGKIIYNGANGSDNLTKLGGEFLYTPNIAGEYQVLNGSYPSQSNNASFNFNETSGNFLSQGSFGFTNTLVPSGTVNRISGVSVLVANSVQFPSGSNFLESSTSNNSVSAGKEFSIALWVRRDGVTVNDASIVAKWAAGQKEWTIGYTTSNQIYFLLSQDGTNNFANYVISPSTLTVGLWHHVIVSWDGSKITMFYDGKFADRTPCSGIFNSGTANLTVSKDVFGAGGNFVGSVANLEIRQTKISLNEAAYLYNAGLGRTIPSPVNELITTWTPTRTFISNAIGLSGANYGTSGQVLTSQGSGSAPIWSSVSGGGTYYAPSTLVANATDANFTATVNGVHNILDGVASANRVITIPTGSNGDVMKFYNTEDTRVWSFTGATVYLADRVTVVTELLYNVPCHMERIDGRWIITN
jgi:hypothetical protein